MAPLHIDYAPMKRALSIQPFLSPSFPHLAFLSGHKFALPHCLTHSTHAKSVSWLNAQQECKMIWSDLGLYRRGVSFPSIREGKENERRKMKIAFIVAAVVVCCAPRVTAEKFDMPNVGFHAARVLLLPFRRDFADVRTKICSRCLPACGDETVNIVHIEAEGAVVRPYIPPPPFPLHFPPFPSLPKHYHCLSYS
jgi:hypothetical protein